jgi:hypothetical protein
MRNTEELIPTEYCNHCGIEHGGVCEGFDDSDEPEERQVFFNDSPVRFVNVYWVTRNYGGPQEGGWWYDAGELQECHVCTTEEEAEKLALKLDDGKFSNEGLRDLGSVLSSGVFRVLISERPGHDWPEERPHYE